MLWLGGLLAGAAAVGAAMYLLRDRPSPAQTARPYLQLWQTGRFDQMKAMVANPPPNFSAIHSEKYDALMAAPPAIRMGRITESEGTATARFSARLELEGLGFWTYRSRLTLRRGKDRWLVDWSPATLHPDLRPGRRFSRTRSWPERAPILASNGAPVAAGRLAVVVGMQPSRVIDINQVTSALQSSLGSDPQRIEQLLDRGRANPNGYIPITEIPEERYQQVRSAIYDIPGLVFQRQDLRLPLTEEFARQLIGRVGEVTREGLEGLGDPYLPGDRVGQFGLEEAMERQLAGRPSGDVRIVDDRGVTVKVLQRFPGEPPQPVTTSLDIGIQRAADAALEGIDKPVALVVLDSTSAEVRAVSNRPLTGYNRAVEGRYPPGSTLKVVTTAALLSSGLSVDRSVECPSQTSAGGRRFRNFEGKGLGKIDFRTAFVESCNTAFANLVRELDDERLLAAAESFGFGVEYSLEVATAGGSFPPPSDTTERVAAAIGQGRVQASPLHMASVAAAAASGGWRPPRLIFGRDPAAQATDPRPIDPSAAGPLRELMASVVAEGTGKAAAVPGRQVAGKTGTAEFGTDTPPKTHAWFIGFSGPLAFAILVEDGGVGGEVAAPIAARFLSMLNGA